MKRTAFLLSVFLVFAALAGNALAGSVSSTGVSATGENADYRANQNKRRAELTYQIVKKWAPYVEEAYRMPAKKWAMEMVPLFRDSSPALMERAANARTFDAMNSILLQTDKLGSSEPGTTKALGDIANDLVFVPVEPCRILDTRLAGGVMAANTARSFDVTAVSDYAFQGGSASNCNGVGAAGSFAIAAINFTVVNPVVPLTGGGLPGTGFITAYPFLTTQPLVANMVYKDNVNLSNLTLVKLDQGASANELTVYTSHQTHLAGDIVGYLINPQATQLDCVEVTSAGVDIAAGATSTQNTANCPTGYEITGGGCSSSTFDGKIVTSRSFDISPTIQYHFCAFRNQGAGTASFIAYGRCCRVPGR